MSSSNMKWNNVEPPRQPDVCLYPLVTSHDWGSIPHIHKGIANFGNTCFINATVQILFHSPNFVRWLTSCDHLSKCHSTLSCLLCHLLKTYRQYKSCKDPHIRPAAFAALTRNLFSNACTDEERDKQEDAHECLVFILSKVEEIFLNQLPYLPDFFSAMTNPVFRMFGGWLTTECVCPKCLNVSKTYSPFTSLSIDVQTVRSEQGNIERYERYESVQEATNAFFEGEKADEYTCSNCSQINGCVTKTTCQKRFSFHEAPSTLVLHLKRFEEDRSKLLSNIKVDQELMQCYRLSGAVLHTGPSSDEGHYLSLLQCPDKTWTVCNDSKVKQVTQSYANSKLDKYGYILFYNRADVMPQDKNSSPKKTVRPMPIEKTKKIGPKESSSQKRDFDDSGCAPLTKCASPGKFVSPINIIKRRKTLPKENSTVSSNDYLILLQTNKDFSSQNRDIDDLGCAPLTESTSPGKRVSPINIIRRRKTLPKENSTVSSNDYFILSQTNQYFSSQRQVVDDLESASQVENVSSAKNINPIKIRRTRKIQKKEISEQSSHDYCIISQTNNLCGSSKGFSVVPPMDEGFQDHHSDGGSPKGDGHNFDSEVGNEFHGHYSDFTSRKENGCYEHDSDNDSSYKNDDILHHQPDSPGSPMDEGFHERQMHEEDNEDMFIENSPSKASFKPIILYENEVDGAILPKKPLISNTRTALVQWLKFRGIPTQGTKDELVERVAMVMGMGKSHIIDPRAKDGKAYEAKAAADRQAAGHLTMLTQASQQIPENLKWQKFPSVDLPMNFNFGHIYFYLIESCPTMPSDEDSLDSESDSETSECEQLPDPFDDDHKTINEVKMLRKGLKFFKSKFVRGVQDSLGERCYFLKGQVRASMSLKAYEVTVTISKRSGSIHNCTCQCIQQALGRCVHVSAVLLHVWSHIRLNGYSAVTCTSVPRVWDKGSLKRDPGPIRETQYDSFKINVQRRAYFDPRPTSRQNSQITQEQINILLFDLSTNPEETLFQKHLKMKYPEERYSPLELKHLSTKCCTFVKSLPSLKKRYQLYFYTPDGALVYELPQTVGQSKSKRWLKYRCIHMTGTAAYTALHLSSMKAKKNFLRKHLWGLDRVQTEAMKYGSKNEKKALEAYTRKRQKIDGTAIVDTNCGLLKRDNFPEAAASVDAITFSRVNRPRVVEIKCPYILRNHNPNFYKKVLRQSQKDSFCLGYSKERGNYLKKGSPYYSQVQHYLGILGLEVCDFVIWSKKGTLVVEVKFDKEHWEKIKAAVVEAYWNLLVPEYFLMRTPRKLEPMYFNWKLLENTLEADLENL